MSGLRLRNFLRLTGSYIVLVILAIAAIYPALWIILGSVRPGKSLYSKTHYQKAIRLSTTQSYSRPRASCSGNGI